MNKVITFDHVFKKYRINSGWYPSLRDHTADLVKRGKRLLLGGKRQSAEDNVFWALRDVSFEIAEGESVGLIGPNGAGKSTILKILSRVTVPTRGRVDVKGRIDALIEVGAGFHPELTGRENIYLNGSIMGMKKKQIEATFDSIVDFAEVAQFIDTPVKFYSSGMHVRLGFAIAAHLDPDILLIDEILAVGDASFQAKCLNKIADLKEKGRTTLLVSHNLSNIKDHTQKVIWLAKGQVAAVGDPDDVVEKYLQSLAIDNRKIPTERSFVNGDRPIEVTGLKLLDSSGAPRESFVCGEEAVVEIHYDVSAPVDDPVFSVSFRDVQGRHVGGVATTLGGLELGRIVSQGVLRFKLTPVLFLKGAYVISVAIRDRKTEKLLDLYPDAGTLVVKGTKFPVHSISGHVYLPHQWEIDGRETANPAIGVRS